MKKVILSIAIVAGLVISANVQNVNAVEGNVNVSMVLSDDGFVDVQLQDLSEAVQAAITAFAAEYDVTSLQFNAEKQLTKVSLTKKDDQSEKVVYLDAEGKEVEAPAQTEEVEAVEQEAPSAELSGVSQDNGFVVVKFEELNEKVQEAVRTLAATHDITSLKYDAEKAITEVKGTSKEDQSEKVVYLNAEGEVVEQPAAPAEQAEQQQTEETPMSF